MTSSTPTPDLHLTDRARRAPAGFGVAPAVVSIERLGKRYGRRHAVDGVSFEVNEREVVGLLGPNGSGKTTILRILTGYLRPSEGTVRIDGFDVVRDGHQARARVGYVPENAPLYGHMRVDEFLHFMGRLRGMQGPALRRGVESARARLALDAVGDAVIGLLSRGYRQRVSIAQAVLHEPKLLVLDEPTNGLDPRGIRDMRDLLISLNDSGVTVFLSSHLLPEVSALCTRIGVLDAGRLVLQNQLADLEQPTGRVMISTEDPERAVAALDGLVERREGADLVVRSADPAALNTRLVAAGVPVRSLAAQRRSLEEIVLDVTGAGSDQFSGNEGES